MIVIGDPVLRDKWRDIKKYLTIQIQAYSFKGILVLEHDICKVYIAKRSQKFRIKSFLDWSHYDAKDLANALNLSKVDDYYAQMLDNPKSDPNIWPCQDLELKNKTYYAVRMGRASNMKV